VKALASLNEQGLLPAAGGPAVRSAPSVVRGAVADAVISVEGLSASFGRNEILQQIDLEIPRHEVTALVGPSGSGKTTFLRALNRMNDRVRGFSLTGRVELDGHDIYGRRVDPIVVRKRIGMVFQRPNPFPMSIRENVLAGVRAHKMARRSEMNDLAESYLAEVGLWAAVSDRLGDSPYRLSGGQQQLLCLARALAVKPDVLLLDEPTSSLDPISTEAVEQLLERLKDHLSIVIVTHNLAQARRISDRTVFFHTGRLVETAPTVDLFESPVRPETARYIGGDFG
jgi:phosphate transport system ATP-binding protein